MLGSIPATKGVKQRLMMAPTIPKVLDQGQSSYKPTTAGGKLRAKLQLVEEICQQLFTFEGDKLMVDLDEACHQLESSMGRMMQVQWGSVAYKQNPISADGREEEDDPVTTNIQFDHSWKSSGPELGPGWHWIPKGNLSLDIHYPARQDEIRRFGHIARCVRRLPPPAPLSCSFSSVVERGMVNCRPNRPMKRRRLEARRVDEEDDLLKEDFKLEHDIRR
jgi:hypothetical protein